MMRLDSDFVVQHACMGRPRGWRRVVADIACLLLGHNLWRSGCRIDNPDGSLALNASYCRRCFKGGYVKSDYWR
jgi:hypothetical protein